MIMAFDGDIDDGDNSGDDVDNEGYEKGRTSPGCLSFWVDVTMIK